MRAKEIYLTKDITRVRPRRCPLGQVYCIDVSFAGGTWCYWFKFYIDTGGIICNYKEEK